MIAPGAPCFLSISQRLANFPGLRRMLSPYEITLGVNEIGTIIKNKLKMYFSTYVHNIRTNDRRFLEQIHDMTKTKKLDFP